MKEIRAGRQGATSGGKRGAERRGAPQGPDGHLQAPTGSSHLSVRAKTPSSRKQMQAEMSKATLNETFILTGRFILTLDHYNTVLCWNSPGAMCCIPFQMLLFLPPCLICYNICYILQQKLWKYPSGWRQKSFNGLTRAAKWAFGQIYVLETIISLLLLPWKTLLRFKKDILIQL